MWLYGLLFVVGLGISALGWWQFFKQMNKKKKR